MPSPKPRKDDLGLWVPQYRDKWRSGSQWCTNLSRTEKALYAQITEQPTISRAGVLLADTEALAEQHPDATEEEIVKDLDGLVSKGLLESSGQWVFICSWFREYERNIRNPNHIPSITRDILNIQRRELRMTVSQALLDEFRDAADYGEVFASAVIDVLRRFATAADLPFPEVVGKAVAKPRRKR